MRLRSLVRVGGGKRGLSLDAPSGGTDSRCLRAYSREVGGFIRQVDKQVDSWRKMV